MQFVLLLSVLLVSTVAASRAHSGFVLPLQNHLRARKITVEPQESSSETNNEIAPSTTTIGSTSHSDSSSSSFKPSTEASSITTPTTVKPSSAITPIKEESSSTQAPTELPVSLPTVLLPPAESDGDLDMDPPKRRIVTYDQRQEGQYNIRADLENFMIVLIPPSPSEGLNLLDLLTKSALHRNSFSTKQKRRQFGALQSNAAKYRNALKSTHGPMSLQYVTRQPEPLATRSSYLQALQQPSAHTLSTIEVAPAPNRLSEYIEGRTPYHVDITATDDEQLRLHPDRQVDVLPPPYPLAYQHLIKPFHLEAEPTVIQALPPPELNTPGSFLESYNQLLAANLPGSNNAGLDALSPSITSTTASTSSTDNGNSGYFRLSRAIRGDSFLDTNRVSTGNSLNNGPRYLDMPPVYRSEHSMGAAELYPPIDAPRVYLTPHMTARNFELQEADNREQSLDEDTHEGEFIVPPADLPGEDDIEWGRFFDTYVKDMRAARCAPGHRRDSYGNCREIEY